MAAPSPRALSAAALVVLLLAGTAGADPEAAERAARDRVAYCSLLAQCRLPVPGGFCPAEVSGGVEDVTYDDARCAEARELHAHGIDPRGDLGYRLYRFLGRRYRVEYLLSGRVPIRRAQIAALVDDLPFAARLLTHLRGRTYTAEYLDPDHRRFRASKGDTLTGEAEAVAGSAQEGLLLWFGAGHSQVGPWRLSGLSFVRFAFREAEGDPRQIDYDLRVVSSPVNGFYNVVMNLGVFKGLVRGQLDEVVADMTGAVEALDSGGVLGGTWTPEDRARIEALRRAGPTATRGQQATPAGASSGGLEGSPNRSPGGVGGEAPHFH